MPVQKDYCIFQKEFLGQQKDIFIIFSIYFLLKKKRENIFTSKLFKNYF